MSARNGKGTPPKSKSAKERRAAGIADRRHDEAVTQHMEFDDNSLVQSLFGPHHSHLALIEQTLSVTAVSRGNQLTVAGEAEQVETACAVLQSLYERLDRGLAVERPEVEAALRIGAPTGSPQAGGPRDQLAEAADIVVRSRSKVVSPRSPNQTVYLQKIDSSDLVFATGPAGTGKTYLAVAKAVERLLAGDVDRIILSRPAVEAGEQLGFLPGDMREKVDPYLRPLYDALFDMMPPEKVARALESGEIEVAPLAFMRGRTLANAFVILDEAQNTTAVQMKMLLTRLGENSSMVITGDLSQVDLPRGTRSGLRDALDVLENVEGVSCIVFNEGDVVRHPLVGRIVTAYGQVEKARRAGARYESLHGATQDGSSEPER